MKQTDLKGRGPNFISVFITLVFLCFSFEGFSKEHKEQHKEQKTLSNLNQDSATHQKKSPPADFLSPQVGYAMSLGLAVVPGYGVGHVVQGRWLERGWIFTLVQTVSLGFWLTYAMKNLGANYSSRVIVRKNVAGGVYVGSKIWEIADAVLNAPHHKMGKSPRFQVNPLFVWRPSDHYDLGLSLKYRF